MIDRFQDENILVNSKVPEENVPLYSKLDISKMGIVETTPLVIGDGTQTEVHIYSANNLLQSDTNGNTLFDSNGILLTPEVDIRNSNIEKGYYSLVYNFLKPVSPSGLKIERTSADGTEVELSTTTPGQFGAIYGLQLLNQFNAGSTNLTADTLVLNFGNNELAVITDVSFKNNPRVGEKTVTLNYPTRSIGGRDTTFYPSLRDQDENFWIELFDNDLTTTGTASKFTPIVVIDSDNPFEKTALLQQESDLNDDLKFYTNDNSDIDKFFDINPGELFTDENVRSGANVKFFDDSIKINEITNIVVKLYKPLNPSLESLECRIDRLMNDSYIERILVYPGFEIESFTDFSPPNFKIDLGNYGGSKGTDLKSWNSLLDANLSTSQQIINKYISSSFGEMDMNVDYSELENFVHYSSAVERVRNFKYKLQLIESYDARIATLNGVSGSHALTNISQSLDRKHGVISGFDGFENWMYYESTGSLYTHYSSSEYVISPWPKVSEYPLKLEHSTSSTATTYYNDLIDTSTTYDVLNDARLTKSIPISIANDTLNADYVLFVDMIGHHFDITWSYINKLTTLNTREEHPHDGIPNELLYGIAKSAGWKLSHGKQASELWKYGLGKNQSGNPTQSGSMASKSDEQINYEVWRRIVNNLPYLLKTKGTARSVKALIATYGIPQSFLNIKEYGGPVIEPDEMVAKPIYEHDKFVYIVKMDDTTNYISVPWGNINDLNPNTYVLDTANPIDTIELQFKHTNTGNKHVLLSKSGSTSNALDFLVLLEPTASNTSRGNIHLYLSGSSGYKSASITDVPVFDNKMSSLFLKRDTSVNDIHQNNSYTLHYRRQRNGEIAVRESASISVSGDATASFNPAWTGSGTFLVGSADTGSSTLPSLVGSSNYINGFVQEIRYYTDPLNDTVMDDHTLSRMSYHGNTPTASYFDLKFRFLPSSELTTITSPDTLSSKHPNQNITTTSAGAVLSASIVGVASDNLNGVTDTYYTKTPSVGPNNISNNKVRVESSTLSGVLDPDHKKEKSRYDTAPVDTNKLGVFLSATNMYNEDVLNHTGFFTIDDYIGNPDSRNGYHDTNVELEHLRRQVFKKYSSKNLINTVIDILTRFDLTVFQQIKQVLPARVDYDYGILIEPHILERPKVTSNSSISRTRPQYETTLRVIKQNNEVATGSYITYNGTITSDNIYNVTASREDIASVGSSSLTPQYTPAQYQYTILNYSAGTNIGFGINWTTGSNGPWNYTVLGTTAVNNTLAQHAKTENYFYSSSLSASLKLYYSSSLSPAEVSTDYQSLSMNNLKFNGCKVSSDSLTTNSPDTPDGLPVIEIFTADPNVLTVTTPLAAGSLTVDANTGLQYIPLQDTIAYGNMLFNQQAEYNQLVSEFNQEIQLMSEFENDRINTFDDNYNQQLNNQLSEDDRQASFDSINTI